MSSRVCFLYLKRQETGLYVAEENDACVQIRKKLEENGVSTMVYTDNALPSVEDFIDDLLSSIDDNIAFWCDDKNVELVKVIAEQLIEMEPDTNIVYLSASEMNDYKEKLDVVTGNYVSAISNELELQLTNIEELPQISKTNEEDKNEEIEEYDTFYNGYQISRLGTYLFNYRSAGYAKHVRIHAEHVTDEFLQSLNKFCAINSSLYIEGAELVQYNDYKEKLADNGVLPINLIFKEGDLLVINGEKPKKKKELQEISYLDAVHIKEEQDGVHYVFRLSEKEELDCFGQELERYYNTGGIADTPFLFGQIKNVCRFQSRNSCKMSQFPRFTIGKEGEMYPCDDCSTAIGNVEQDYYEVVQELYIQRENVIKERNCKECPANIYCPKCTLTPQQWENGYCELMINKPYVTDYLVEISIINRLLMVTPYLAGKQIEDVKVINEYIAMFLKEVPMGNCAPYFAKYLFVSVIDDIYIIWAVTGKFYRVSKEIAVVVEALLKRLSLKEILKVVEETCNLTPEQSYLVCETAIKKFDSCNILYNKVDMEELEGLKPQGFKN